MSALADRCIEEDVRLERIVHLDVMKSPLDIDLADWLIDYCSGLLRERFGVVLPEEVGRDDLEDVEQQLWEVHGWLVEAATPVKRRVGPGLAGAMYSWAQCHVATFCGATYEEALERAFEWARQRGLEDLERAS